jgi:hypothetical protein
MPTPTANPEDDFDPATVERLLRHIAAQRQLKKEQQERDEAEKKRQQLIERRRKLIEGTTAWSCDCELCLRAILELRRPPHSPV